jgi:hypothetical protein
MEFFSGDPLSLGGYLFKSFAGICVFGLLIWCFLKAGKRRGWIQKNSDNVCIISSLPLGRDVFFVVRCGPEVFALSVGNSGTRVIGRWDYERWIASQKQSSEEGASE